MRESDCLPPIAVQVGQTHGDHSGLLLIDIDELNQTFLTAGLEVPLAIGSALTGHSTISLRLVEHHLNVPLANA
eukprot:CAMPEP_0185582664 /NCGR_PEP_ID=MMETSP0434-20130131/21042_1 /TAXON_ID=626734 ORGANISM="Favella taraikaensis, Strain Fe Narragansett Bay" /NCGR_SAMPLE_ID=MMETSP0434 /ASSEMBLY_ACC=CAM_ASM_000379 /LENGTH=73 /DNA_ID=CAMNT_0028201547 /DNA_START=1607 /DNA_END=1828 /DNA_ORIENTATION=-